MFICDQKISPPAIARGGGTARGLRHPAPALAPEVLAAGRHLRRRLASAVLVSFCLTPAGQTAVTGAGHFLHRTRLR